MNPANNPAVHWLTDYVLRCGSKRSAAHALGIPRGTLRRWLKEIERTGVVHSSPKRVEALRNRLIERGRAVDTADALMGVFGYRRADCGDDAKYGAFAKPIDLESPTIATYRRGDDMTCASFPDELDMQTVHAPLVGGGKFKRSKADELKYVRSQAANDFATSAFATTQGTNVENVRKLMRKGVHKSRIGDEKARKRKSVLFLYDIHLPNQSDENIEIALDYAQTRHEIDTVVIGGDFLDCAGISRWKKDPYGTMPLHEEIARGVAWLETLRKRFSKANVVFIKGNHEDRLQSYLWNQAAEISKLKGLKLQDQLELDRLGIQWVDNLERIERGQGAYSIGKLNILHGHELGICPAVDCARKYFFKALENIILGHVHKRDEHTEPTLNDIKGAWVVGHLQNEHPAYRPFNKWVAGFALGHFDGDGLFSIKNKKIIEGRVL